MTCRECGSMEIREKHTWEHGTWPDQMGHLSEYVCRDCGHGWVEKASKKAITAFGQIAAPRGVPR